MNKDEFINNLSKIGINIDENTMMKLDKYYELLVSWNEKMNLTGITDYKEVLLKHFYDSLTLNSSINLNNINILCDIGTGAGFPGMVIKIVFPKIKVTLVDSLGKRITFLNEIKKELKLENLEIINKRAEDYAKDIREKFDVVTSRAVAPLNILSEYCIPLVKVDGYFIAMKADIKDEVNLSKKIIEKLSSKVEDIHEFLLPYENSKRSLVKIKKLKTTSSIFPRKYSDIKNKPII